jgi:phosphate acetyltransferase
MYTADLDRDGVTKNPALIGKERKMLEESGLKPLAMIPSSDILGKRSVREVMTAVKDGVCLYGHELLDESINDLSVYTMQVDDLLEKDVLKEGDLVMVSHKRVDVLMSLLLAAQSKNSPTPAGILLSGFKSGDMSPKVTSMLNGLDDIRFPIIATSADTFHAAKEIEARPVFMTAESTKKLAAAKDLMEDHLDFSFLDHFLSDEIQAKKRDIGPRMFQYSQVLAARKLQKTIVLPEGADPRVVEAASILVNRKLCKVLLVGDPAVIKANADKVRVSLDGVTICDPQNYEGMDNMINAFVEARKSKGLTALEAENFLKEDVNYFGTLMMHLGLADGMVSGAMHSSANTIRPALQVLKTAPGAKLVSSFFFMLLEDGVKVFGDCAINVSPTSDELAEIAVASAKNAIKFGIDPRVALLSYATGDSNKGDLIDKVVKATAKAKEIAAAEGFMDPDLIQGPLQFDAAVDPAVAAVKAKDSRVAGRANVLIFPDLNAGNNGYKAVQQASKTIAVGPVLQGLKKPVNDLSRGATVDDIVNTAIITALQAA